MIHDQHRSNMRPREAPKPSSLNPPKHSSLNPPKRGSPNRGCWVKGLIWSWSNLGLRVEISCFKASSLTLQRTSSKDWSRWKCGSEAFNTSTSSSGSPSKTNSVDWAFNIKTWRLTGRCQGNDSKAWGCQWVAERKASLEIPSSSVWLGL